jgi:hypothetical protein
VKPAARQLDVTTTLEGEKVGMTIDQGALAHIMSVLTDLYSDPELAVIREYSTNAFDSHVEAGVNKPIEVTLPSPLAPFFRVRDFGIGLDAEGIREVYSRYGTSTKRGSDDVVGMLGLGCKSALTYTDQFTVVGIKDGVMTQISVSRDEDGAGSMTIVSQEPTNQPQGVEIIVPAKAGNRFEEKARDFFRFWDKGRVLVNGEPPVRIDGMWIADDIVLSDNLDRSYVVMGNVAYPNTDSLHHGHYGIKEVVFVPIGSVHFTPSREALQMTAQTKLTLANLKSRIKTERDAAFDKMISESKNQAEAIRTFVRAKLMGYSGNPEFRGLKMPVSQILCDSLVVHSKSSWGRAKGVKTSYLYLTQTIGKQHFVVNFDAAEFSPHKRKKLNIWESQNLNGNAPESYIMLQQLPAEIQGWVPKETIHDWADIDAIKVPSDKTPSVKQNGRPSGSYKAVVDGVHTDKLLAADIDTKKPLFWTRGWSGGVNIIKSIYPDATIMLLPQNRIEKFKRDFPMATAVNDHLWVLAKKWYDGLTDEDILVLQVRQLSQKSLYAAMDSSQLDDPEMVKYVQAAKSGKQTQLWNEYYQWRDYLNSREKIANLNKQPLDNYPLVMYTSTYQFQGATKTHAYIYMNAVYAKVAAGKEV